MIRHLSVDDMPQALQLIPNAPQQLHMMSNDQEALDTIMSRKRVAIVGTRNASAYGQEVASRLSAELAAHGVVIVSGLAFGIDAIAHQAAVTANGLSVAVLPSPVEFVVPRAHTQLARQVIDHGGVLLSEYPKGAGIYRQNFVARNRIVTGISDALLIIEAAEDSGTLHTAKYAKKQGIKVLVVPGNITSPTSAGTNNLLKEGATPITGVLDVLQALDLPEHQLTHARNLRVKGDNEPEQKLIDLLEQGVSQGSLLLARCGLSVPEFNHHLTMLEINGKIRSLGADNWALA